VSDFASFEELVTKLHDGHARYLFVSRLITTCMDMPLRLSWNESNTGTGVSVLVDSLLDYKKVMSYQLIGCFSFTSGCDPHERDVFDY